MSGANPQAIYENGIVMARNNVLEDQFGDVAAQEMWREPGGRFALELAALLPDVAELHTLGPGRYETVVRLGEHEGFPLFTVTHGTVADLDPAAPTAPYLHWIATGLAEAHGWCVSEIVDYMQAAPGVQAPVTPGFQGAGNEKPRSCRKGQVRRGGKCVKKAGKKNHRRHGHKGKAGNR